MSGETWARVSLRITGQRLTAREIEQHMGRMSSSRSSDVWAIDLAEGNTIGLDEQLQIAKDYLRGEVKILEKLTDCEINLSIGWTPQSPQDGIILDAEMIALLSSVRCYVLLDTYLD